MNVSKLTPNPIHEQIDECARRLDAVAAIATAFSIANAAGSLDDSIVFQPKLMANAWDGIALMTEDAQRVLHGK